MRQCIDVSLGRLGTDVVDPIPGVFASERAGVKTIDVMGAPRGMTS